MPRRFLAFALAMLQPAAFAQALTPSPHPTPNQPIPKETPNPSAVSLSSFTPDASDLLKQIQTAYKDLQGLKFRVATTFQMGDEKPGIGRNQPDIQATLARSHKMHLRVNYQGAEYANMHDDLIFDNKTLLHVRRLNLTGINKKTEKLEKVEVSGYSKHDVGKGQELMVAASFEFSDLFDALALWRDGVEVLSPTHYLQGQIPYEIKRLPARTIDGVEVDGIQIRWANNFAIGLNTRKISVPQDTITYWFGVTDHLLRRRQTYTPSQRMSGGRDPKGHPRPGYMGAANAMTTSFLELEANPSFEPGEFQLTPPRGSVKVEDARALRY